MVEAPSRALRYLFAHSETPPFFIPYLTLSREQFWFLWRGIWPLRVSRLSRMFPYMVVFFSRLHIQLNAISLKRWHFYYRGLIFPGIIIIPSGVLHTVYLYLELSSSQLLHLQISWLIFRGYIFFSIDGRFIYFPSLFFSLANACIFVYVPWHVLYN
jgi:hypothetical protein